MATGIEIFGRTDVGRMREGNEDNFLCLELGADPPQPAAWPCLLAVADGIGGHLGGAQASALAVQTLKEEVLAGLRGPAADPQGVLERAFQRANEKIFVTASGLANSAGMGTTMVAALARPDLAVVSNVGDSRAYLVRRGTLYPITTDHSWVAEQKKLGVLTPREIAQSPFRTLVTRSLGYENEIKVDAFQVDIEPGDALFLCTDGLYGPVPEKKISRVFKRAKSSADICAELIRLANENGGPDNITAVVARFLGAGKRGKDLLGGTIALTPAKAKDGKG